MCGFPSRTAGLPTAWKLHMTQMYRVMTTTKKAFEKEKPKSTSLCFENSKNYS